MADNISEKSASSCSSFKTLEQQAVCPEPPENEVGELVDFLRLIDRLPIEYRAEFYKSLDRLVDGFERRQRILGCIQDSLTQMNLDLKYLIFDLEATRRERDKYRQLYEETLM